MKYYKLFKNLKRHLLDPLSQYGTASLFKNLIFERVISRRAKKSEVIDLYRIGTFSTSESFLNTNTGSDLIVKENVELVKLKPKSEYQPHIHYHSTAVIYIFSGSGLFRLGDECIPYNTEKRIFIPSGVAHGFETEKTTWFLSIQSPPIINPTNGAVDLHYENEEHL